MHSQQHILIIEANKPDVFLIQDALALASVEAVVRVIHDGDAATDSIDTAVRNDGTARPDVVLIDLNVPDEYFRKLTNYNEFMKLGPL